ncbi:MAG TPA: hypothetical protein VMB25_23240 [Bryobacteraceae bacterium]|nr:hypothetical protein [Bryobacteraceae bacterium]
MIRCLSFTILIGLGTLTPPSSGSPNVQPLIDRGYREMYDLQFASAHQTFREWEKEHPRDPIGPASNAAAYLFSEFDRLHILQAEFFVQDGLFRRLPKLHPDPAIRAAFDEELQKADQLSDAILQRMPEDADALFARILALGLRADYQSLIERRDLDALKVIKTSRATAEKLLSIEPDYYDAYLAVGVENYLFSLKPAPVRWFLEIGGGEVDRERGIEDLRLTAEKGHYLSPYARLLLGVAALREKDRGQARDILKSLAQEFPHNRLYTEELERLH